MKRISRRLHSSWFVLILQCILILPTLSCASVTVLETQPWTAVSAKGCGRANELTLAGAKTRSRFMLFSDRANQTTNRVGLLLPPTGGMTRFEQWFAQSLCENGLDVLVLDYPQDSPRWSHLEDHNTVAEDVLFELGRALAGAEKQVVVIGSSLGGIYATLVLGLSRLVRIRTNGTGVISNAQQTALLRVPAAKHFAKVDRAVIIAAGAPFTDILLTSQQSAVIEQRTKRMSEFSYSSLAEYRTALEEKVIFDPARFVHPDLKNSVLMFIAGRDDVVPTSTQEQLWHLLGQPQRYDFRRNGHTFAIGRSYLYAPEIIRWLK